MKPNLFCHTYPAHWGNPHEIQLRISPTNRKTFDALPRGEEGTKTGVIVYDQITRSYWAVRRFPCFTDSFDGCCCAAQARRVKGPKESVKWPEIEFPDPEEDNE